MQDRPATKLPADCFPSHQVCSEKSLLEIVGQDYQEFIVAHQNIVV